MNPDSLAETRQAPVEKTDPTGAFYLRAYPDGECRHQYGAALPSSIKANERFQVS
jgi:hypothetical protein